MNNEQLAILAEELKRSIYADAMRAQRYEEVADYLNRHTYITNPTPQGQVPARFTWETFLALLTGAEIWGMYSQGGDFTNDFRAALEGNRITERNRLWTALKTVLPAQTATAVETAYAETIPDPDWSPTVAQPSIADSLGLPRVSPVDVQAVDQG